MPIYEYRCEECGVKVDCRHGMNEQGPGLHPGLWGGECGPLRRIMSLPTIRPNGIAPSGSDAPALHNTGNRARRLWMNPDGTTKEQSEWRPAFDGDPGRQVG